MRNMTDDYDVLGKIAGGGQSDVYEAVQRSMGRRVIVKAARQGDPEAPARLRAETEILSRVRSSHVVSVIDQGWIDLAGDSVFAIVLELIDAPTLATRLHGGLTIDESLRALREIAQALEAIHGSGGVHRDLKPENCLMATSGVVVIDLGYALVDNGQKLTAKGFAPGTTAYMSPEQMLGRGATPRSDQYALAVLAWEMLLGSRPFRADNDLALALKVISSDAPRPSTLAPSLPRGVDAALQRALARDPAKRFESPLRFVEALEEAFRPPAERAARAPEGSAAGPWLVAAATAVATAASVIATFTR